MNRLKKHFDHITRYDLLIKDHFVNVMESPYLNKIVLNIGLGQKLIVNRKEIIPTLLALELIGSQRATLTRAKKSIDKFKLKKKMVIGSKVTLRKKNMFFFLDRLINEILPNLENLEEFHKKYKKSLKSIKKKNQGSLTKMKKSSFLRKNPSWNTGFGLNDFFSFKEIPYDKFESSHGLNIALSLKQGYSSKKLAKGNAKNSTKRSFKPARSLERGPAFLKGRQGQEGIAKISFHLKGLSVNNFNDNVPTDNRKYSDPGPGGGGGIIKTVKNPGIYPYNYVLSSFQLPLA